MRHRGFVAQVLLVVMLIGQSTPAQRGRWFGPDRVKHFFLSFFVQSASYSITRTANVGHGPALAVASGVTAAASVSKEIWDRKRGTGFDKGDLVWDALGAGAATALLVRTVDE
jgi:uncharacterized protein YfiM (DUF2279 family)